MATFYHWSDAAGPARAQGGSFFERFKNTLIACLVNGYQGKPAAGWTLYHDVPGSGFSLMNASGRIVNFVINTASGSYYNGARVYLIEGPLNSSAGLLQADLVRSGSGAPSANPQGVNLNLVFGDPNNGYYSSSTWTILADDKTFIFYGMSNYWGFNDNLPWPLLYVGEDTEGNFLSIGGQNTATFSNISGYFSGSGFTYLRHPLTGLLITTEPGLGLLSITSGAGRTTYTDNVAELELAPVQVVTGTTIFSKLRGMAQDFSKQGYSWAGLLSLLGGSGSTASRGRPYTVDGMEVACVNASLSNGPILFMTSDPAFW